MTALDNKIEDDEGLNLLLSKGSTKIMPDTIFIKMYIKGQKDEIVFNEELELTLSVNIEQSSNTVGAISYKGIINKFNLNSKHSVEDLKLFQNEITENILNSIKLSQKNN